MVASVTKVERLWGLVRAIACSLWLTADLVTFTGEILNGKLHFLFSGTETTFHQSWNNLKDVDVGGD